MTTHFPKGHGIATMFLACSVLFLAACGGTAGGTSGGTAIVTKPVTATQILANAGKHSSLKDATFDMTITYSSGSPSIGPFTASGKMTLNPPRSDTILSGSVLGQPFTDETIMDGYDMYSKTTGSTIGSTSGDKWVKTTTHNISAGGIADPSLLTTFANLQNVTLVGTETINGHQAYHLKGTFASAPTPGTSDAGTNTSQGDLWLMTDSYYPLKNIVTSTVTRGATTATMTLVTTFKTWNTGITISVPPPSDLTTG